MKNAYLLLLLTGVAVGLSTCNPHPNSARRRFSYAFRTRYNIYHHAKQEYDQGLKAVSIEKFPPDSVLQLFDSCIQKCEKAIRLYSIREKPRKKEDGNKMPNKEKGRSRQNITPFWCIAGY